MKTKTHLKIAAALALLTGVTANASLSATAGELERADAQATTDKGVFAVQAASLYDISAAAQNDGLNVKILGPSDGEIGKVFISISKGNRNNPAVKGLSDATAKELQFAGEMMFN